MSDQIRDSQRKEIGMEAEENRLLDSFKLHEIEARRLVNETPNASNKKESTSDAKEEEELQQSIVQSKVLLKEGELLDGTFGDPKKMPRPQLFNESLKSEEDNMVVTDPKSKTAGKITHEPGPAFTNSSFKEGWPAPKDSEETKPSDNPFYWADASEEKDNNLSKLVV